MRLPAVLAAATALTALLAGPGLRAQGQPPYVTAPVPGTVQGVAAEAPRGWPREVAAGELRLLIYQPQIESWDGHRLQSKAAVAIGTAADPDQNYGVVWFTSRTEVDKIQRVVTLFDTRISRLNFPAAKEREAAVRAALQQRFGAAVRTVSLDRLEASLAASEAQRRYVQAVEIDNTPPRIVFSTAPAVLVLVDGPPVLRPAGNTGLERVVNTHVLLLRDPHNGLFFLRVAGLWAQARALEGPWAPAPAIPSTIEAAKQQALAAGEIDLLDDDDKPDPGLPLPMVYLSTEPAELLQTAGPPQFEPIAGTRLLVVGNTVSDMFVDPATGEHYVLISGRWFRARSFAGPWNYVESTELPGDFRRIPPDHPHGDVLASIAGTPQAEEAMIASMIPQTATIDRNTARFDAIFDGDPQFLPVEGTELHYAPNAPVPVVRVDPTTYYAVSDGVWFTAPSPYGPWVVATFVPPVIYTIPPTSPIYYVTYVRVYGYTPRVVYVGYTPGYFGTYVTRYGVVVYGSGRRYRPWIGHHYYASPFTYGYGAGFAANALAGFILGLTSAAIVSDPWWGPYRWHPRRHEDRREWRRDPPRAYGANVYNRWDTKTVVRTQTVRPRPATPAVAAPPAVTTLRPNDVFAGPDGRAYRRTPDGWERHDGKTWTRALDEEARRATAEREGRERDRREAEARRKQQDAAAARATAERQKQEQQKREAEALKKQQDDAAKAATERQRQEPQKRDDDLRRKQQEDAARAAAARQKQEQQKRETDALKKQQDAAAGAAAERRRQEQAQSAERQRQDQHKREETRRRQDDETRARLSREEQGRKEGETRAKVTPGQAPPQVFYPPTRQPDGQRGDRAVPTRAPRR